MTEPRKINIKLPEELIATFANVVRVSHTPGEFVLDFSAILPGDMNPKVGSRVVMSPLALKLLYAALGENLARYETNFGEIKLPQSHSLANELFHNTSNPPEPEK
jgi:transcription elongation GreA/GreB family factor